MEKIFSANNKLSESDLYIAVPNRDNKKNIINESGKFPYAYKYGRTAGNLQEYVKRIPKTQGTIDTISLKEYKKKYRLFFL